MSSTVEAYVPRQGRRPLRAQNKDLSCCIVILTRNTPKPTIVPLSSLSTPFTPHTFAPHVSGSVWRASPRTQRRTEFQAWKVELAVSRCFWGVINCAGGSDIGCPTLQYVLGISIPWRGEWSGGGSEICDDVKCLWMEPREVAEPDENRCGSGRKSSWRIETQTGVMKSGFGPPAWE